MKNSHDLAKLFEFWDNFYLGIAHPPVEIEVDQKEKIITELYSRTLSALDKALDVTGFSSISHNGNDSEFVNKIFHLAKKLPAESCSFFPRRIAVTGSATCAGQTLLINSMLQKNGLKFNYGRPQGHSMNFVYIGSETWWLDGANAVLAPVEYEDVIVDGVTIRKINSQHPKIPYKLVRLLHPQDIIINFFGNTLALLDWANSNSEKCAVEITEQWKEKIEEANLEKWLFYLYPEQMNYTMSNPDFLAEVERLNDMA